ncbi:helix-turn-helix domain-containing protein [Pseudomonas sp. HS-18]|uniref:helix-turn-helix domain-containing protein n=1 Tax=Pseudomonas sp. HS-18 TaxID=2879114 RepID=UPI001CF04968|nr:XRE family transcriptional regulator [Pseudomonas sp. HS-18]UCL84521.1 XRE family transcriptional regulator [Pseudomonas sp. HS-18]
MASIEQVLANNLKFLMASNPDVGTQPKLELRSGVGQSTIGRILRADGEAKIGTVRDLAKVFKISAKDLLDESLVDRVSGNSDNLSGTPGHAGLVPLISWVTAGMMYEAIDNLAPGDAEEWLESPFPHGNSTFCLRIRGDSMHPEYKDGEIIQVDPDVAAQHNDDVVVRTPDGHTTFKRLQESLEGQFLIALNPEFPDRIIRVPEGTVICGVCTASWKDRRRK